MIVSGGERRINLEGVVAYSGGEQAFSYTQIYRRGIIEAVNGSALYWQDERGRKLIPSIAYEGAILHYLPHCFEKLQELGCAVPVFFALTLMGVKGLQMGIEGNRFGSGHAISAQHLILPETIVEDFATPAAAILKPMFDLVWNACGYLASKNFDQTGRWIHNN
jgi:hypothetical protein